MDDSMVCYIIAVKRSSFDLYCDPERMSEKELFEMRLERRLRYRRRRLWLKWGLRPLRRLWRARAKRDVTGGSRQENGPESHALRAADHTSLALDAT